MIVLDTNVLSEVLKPQPEQRVLDWFAGQLRSSLFTTTVTRGEIAYGIRIMPQGARRQSLGSPLSSFSMKTLRAAS